MATTTPGNGDNVTDNQIAALSKHFFDNVYVMDNGNLRQADSTIDTKSMCFDKVKIDALFAANPTADKLTIHLGLHSSSIFIPDDPRYENKMMVVLEAKSSGATSSPVSSFKAMDSAHLCPPFTNC